MSQEKLSNLAETLIGSEIVKLGNAISVRINNGERIFNYTIGDFDPKIFPIPMELEELIIDSYRQKNTNYPAGDGVIELRKSVSAFIKEWEGLEYGADEIQIACGGRPLIYTIFKTFVDEGDRVIYAAPSWNNNHYAHMTGAEHCVIECTAAHDFMPTAADIDPFIKGATLLCLCTPQNPTGTTLSREELTKICDLVLEENKRRGPEEKKLYLLYDQMYWMLTYGKTVHYNPVSLRPEMRAYTVFVDGITKAFASTGLRVGWAMGPAPVISKIRAILSHLGAWAPMAEQKAVATYLLQKESVIAFFSHFKSSVEKRLHAIYNGFIDLKKKGYNVDAITPQAAIYLTVKVDLAGKTTDTGKLLANQSDVTNYILSEAKLAIVPFSAFGASKTNPWYRVSVGTCKLEELEELFNNLEKALSKLQ